MVKKSPGSGARRVLFIGSEAVPFSKTGGLGDVLGALPAAIARCGWEATLVVPKYRGSVPDGVPVARLPITVGAFSREAGLFEASAGEARVLLVECADLYDREGIYGVGTKDYADNPLRFAFLVRAALDYASQPDRRPSVVHAHDWQAGLAPVYLRTHYTGHPVLGGIPTVFTIHNLSYQGIAGSDWLPRLDLPWDLLSTDRMEYWGRISLLKGGITDATLVTTVSPSYAKEIQTPELGFGFEGVLRGRADSLSGVLNGIDTEVWNPAADPWLPAPYDASDLSGKARAKRALLERFGLPSDPATLARPLIGMVSRLIEQKGLDLIAGVADELASLDASFTVIGTGEARYEEMWHALSASHPLRIAVFVGFDEERAHLIEAGADLFLMPSRFEPCGLNQMYSLRYGTVPVVHGVGGLADTVQDAGSGVGRLPKGANGFVFHEPSGGAMLEAIRRALTQFANIRRWRALQANGMRADHSWDRSAREYVKIYERALRAARPDQ